MNKETERILTQDSLSETEQILGNKHWSEFTDTENGFALLKVISDNERKTKHLKGLGDTYWGIKWDEFKDLIKAHGFVPALEYEFIKYEKPDEAIIYYHPTKGLIIWATSFDGKDHINGGELYGEIKANSEADQEVIWMWLSTGGCIEDLVYETKQDIREGLFNKLNELETAGVFQNKWIKKNRFLHFVDYSIEDINRDYKIATQIKINKCPQEMRNIIGR